MFNLITHLFGTKQTHAGRMKCLVLAGCGSERLWTGAIADESVAMLKFAPVFGSAPRLDTTRPVQRGQSGHRRHVCRAIGWLSVIAWLVCDGGLPTSAAPPSGSPLAESATVELYRKLSRGRGELGPSLTRWSGVPLRAAAAALESSLDVHVWLDRRLDPEQIVQLELSWDSPWELVTALAAASGAEAAPLESVILIAPPEQLTRTLRGYWELYAAMQTRPATAEPWRWDGVTEVSQLLDGLVTRHRLQLVDDVAVPHDLWFPRRVPPLTPAAQWSLLLGGFGLQLSPAADLPPRGQPSSSWRIASLPEAAPLELSGGGGLPASDRLRAWRGRWPESTLRGSPDDWQISASWSALLDLWWSQPTAETVVGSAAPSANRSSSARPAPNNRAGRSGGRPPASDDRLANDRFTLQYRGSLAPLLERLAADLNLTIDPWPLPQSWQQREVQLQIEQLSIDQLLERIGEQVLLGIRRDTPTRVRVTADR